MAVNEPVVARTTDLRANLANYLTLAESGHRVRVAGRDVELVPSSDRVVMVPADLLWLLEIHLVRHQAGDFMDRFHRGELPNLGASVARYTQWLWDTDRQAAGKFLVRLGAELPELSLDEILRSLRIAGVDLGEEARTLMARYQRDA